MGFRRRLLLSTAALAAFTAFVVQPRLSLMGVGREVVPVNNDRCVAVPGLEACEDAWVDSSSGLAYLACSSPSSRAHWTPAMLHLNASALPLGPSKDKLMLLDLRTRNYEEVKLVGLPKEAEGVWVHGMDVFRSLSKLKKEGEPDKLTLFLVSHRPPTPRSSSHVVGADSVVEIFETRVGEGEARWVKTVRDGKVKTPNSLAAVGERRFFVTNDHRDKVHWTRKWEKFFPFLAPSSIIYCDASSPGPESDCSVAADGLVYPNGLTYSPSSNLVYQASTLGGYVNIFRRSSSSSSSSSSLSLLRSVPVGRPLDNLHLDPSTSSVYATALAKSVDFVAAAKDGGMSGGRAAVEVWRINAEGKKAELVFADLGQTVSASTTAAPFRLSGGKLQLLLTGLFSKEVVLCEIE